jgi:hypothetical protein
VVNSCCSISGITHFDLQPKENSNKTNSMALSPRANYTD